MVTKKSKRGRPKTGNSRKNRYNLRLNDEESGYLDYIFDKTGTKKSDILRKGLKMYYNLEKYKD